VSGRVRTWASSRSFLSVLMVLIMPFRQSRSAVGSFGLASMFLAIPTSSWAARVSGSWLCCSRLLLPCCCHPLGGAPGALCRMLAEGTGPGEHKDAQDAT
jgi:hypothetical protein